MDAPEYTEKTAPASRSADRPRHRWLKRVMLIVGLLLLATLALRVWWGWEAERRLQDKLEEYRAAEQPVLPEDFAMASVPDADNAALVLRKAAAAVVELADAPVSISEVIDAPCVVDECPDDIRLLIEANAEALRLVRGVRARPCADWGVRLTSPVINVMLPDLSPQKNLARVCCVAALYHHQQGNHREAVAGVRDILDIADRVSQMGPFLIVHVLRLTVTDIAVATLEGITHDLQTIGAVDAPVDGGSAVPRAEAESVIRELLDEDPVREGWRIACYGERLMEYDAGGMVSSRHDLWWLFRPALRLDIIRMMEYSTAAADAVLAPDWRTANKLLPRYETAKSGVEMLTRFLSNLLLPALDTTLATHYHSLLRRRLAAVALAIRLYEADHGSLPRALDALVPDYLSAVPKDPFAADGLVIGYCPDAIPPVLYSVGTDGIDEGGRYAFEQAESRPWDSADIVFFLNGHRPPRRPAATPSSQAADDDVNQPAPKRQPD